jgi:hypothetical protein
MCSSDALHYVCLVLHVIIRPSPMHRFWRVSGWAVSSTGPRSCWWRSPWLVLKVGQSTLQMDNNRSTVALLTGPPTLNCRALKSFARVVVPQHMTDRVASAGC